MTVKLPTEEKRTRWNVAANIQFIAPVCKNVTGGDASQASFFNLLMNDVISCSSAEQQRWRRLYLPSGVDTSGSASVVTAQVSAESEMYASDRVINVFCDSPQYLVSSNGVISSETLPLQYVSAGLAVYRSSLLPQQGMSMQNLPWIYACPLMYTKYTIQQLDEMGSYGTFIVTQDDDFSDVYVRHALTTGTANGILYYEDMVGVNVDDISYGIKSIIRPFIGKRNNTQQTLTEIENRLTDYFESLTTSGVSLEERTIGPQIIEYDKETFSVALDENLLDRVNVNVDVAIPLPINVIVVNLNTYQSLTA